MVDTYPVTGLDAALPHRLHHAALLVLHIPHPVRLSRRYKEMGCPALHVPVQFLVFVDAPFGWQVDRARSAVLEAVFAVDGWVDLREELAGGGGGELVFVELGEGVGRGGGG